MISRTLGRTILALCLMGLGAWAALALLDAGADAGTFRRLLAAAMAAATIACAAAVLLGRATPRALAGCGMAILAVMAWFLALEPRNDRPWTVDVSRTPWAEIDGDQVTIHEVRHFAWRTEADFTPRWETRTVDLAALEGVDLLASYWMGDAIAHVMVSFVFADSPPLAVSIETRKEMGEPYSTVLGFFRRYELVYVVADERDLIGVRTNVRADPPEDVYLYRVAMPRDARPPAVPGISPRHERAARAPAVLQHRLDQLHDHGPDQQPRERCGLAAELEDPAQRLPAPAGPRARPARPVAALPGTAPAARGSTTPRARPASTPPTSPPASAQASRTRRASRLPTRRRRRITLARQLRSHEPCPGRSTISTRPPC